MPEATRLRNGALRGWIAACVLGETIGMTAAAFAARAPDTLGIAPGIAGGLLLVVAGGLIEGLALGILQALALRRFIPKVRRLRWAIVTLAVAGVGWAVASAPAALSSGPDTEGSPPLGLILLGAAGLGIVMGAVLGAAQAFVLRGTVLHPWRWIAISVAGWTPAMVVIFAGATAPGTGWPLAAVVGLGTATGLVAGAALGIVTGALLPLLDVQSVPDQMALGVLRSRLHGLFDRSLIGLRIRGVRTGREFELPVMYSRHDDELIVCIAGSAGKRWWRNLRIPAQVGVLVAGRWTTATARLVVPGDPDWADASNRYLRRWPMARRAVSPSDPIVRLALSPSV